MKNLAFMISFNLKNKYEGTLFSYLWSILPIFLQFAILSFITSRIFLSPESASQTRLLIMLFTWSFFKEVTVNSTHLISFKWYHIKDYFIPLKSILRLEFLTLTLTFFFNLTLLFIYLLITNQFNINLLNFIFSLIPFLIFTYLCCIILFILGAIYKDAFHLWNNFTTLLFWTLPIIYTSTKIPLEYKLYFDLHPLFFLFRSIEDSIQVSSTLQFKSLIIAMALLVICLLLENIIKQFRNQVILRL